MALTVLSTHLYPLENALEHHADRFELLQDGSTAILRRGQPFYLGIKFNRPLDKVMDIVRIVFVTGEWWGRDPFYHIIF
jgi:transglutaminase 1